MRSHFRALVLVGCTGLASGCGAESRPTVAGQAGEEQEIVVTRTDSAGVEIVTIAGSVSTLPEWSLSEVPLTEVSGNAAPYIGRVGEVAFWGERGLLVEDRMASQLYAVETNGGWHLLAGTGDGPGEIRGVAQLSVLAGDTVHAFDYGPYRISEFGPDGQFLNSIPVDPGVAVRGTTVRDAWALGSGRFLLFGGNLGDWPPPPGQVQLVVPEGVIRIISADGTPQVSPLWFPGDPYVVIDGPRTTLSPFWNRPFVAVGGGRILHGSGLDYELALLDDSLRPTRLIRWLDWRESLSGDVLDALRDTIDVGFASMRTRFPAAAEQRVDAIFHPDVLPDLLPAIHSALLDEDGRMWVARFQPFEDLGERNSGNNLIQWRQEEIWHVLDVAGLPIARFRLPARTRLLAVQRDRVAVVTRDEFDVEHVRAFAIRREGN